MGGVKAAEVTAASLFCFDRDESVRGRLFLDLFAPIIGGTTCTRVFLTWGGLNHFLDLLALGPDLLLLLRRGVVRDNLLDWAGALVTETFRIRKRGGHLVLLSCEER